MPKTNEPSVDFSENSLGERIITESLSWVGTPWYHNQSKKGIGCDCVGFLVGVGREVGFLPPDFALENYNRIPRNDFLVKSLDSLMPRVTGETVKGDVLVFRKAGVITHVGFYLGGGEMVHADQNHGVIRHYLADTRPPVLVFRPS